MKTNSLIYKTSKFITHDGQPSTIYVSIRFDDECKNGHQDFAITGDIYSNQTGNKSDRYLVAGGCIHEEIAKYFPKFKMFIDLHLCDFNGCPMHAIANGFYHSTEGFNHVKPHEATFKEKFCDHYRITSAQFDRIAKSENKIEYAILLDELGIINQWSEEAKIAIKELELMTGDEFLNDSTRSNYDKPTPEQIADFKEKKANGYYSDEAKRERAKQAREQAYKKRLSSIKNRLNEVICKETTKANVQMFLIERIDKLFKKAKGFNIDFTFDNFIYYNHTNTVKFNWSDGSYNKFMTKEEFDMFCNSLKHADLDKLPTGIKFQYKGLVFSL